MDRVAPVSPSAGLPLLALLLAWTGCAGSPPAEESVRPGINERFLDPELDIPKLKNTFEGESREIFVSRHRIAKALQLRPGAHVADVGAGTGLFLDLLAGAVGAEGKVYALDISPKLVRYIERRAADKKLTQVQAVLCGERSVDLPAQSVDAVFVCDTYHHFEYPQSTLASIRAALRSGGQLVVVDFERIPGKSRKWVLDHVRCGKDVVTQEIEAAGFRLVEEVQVQGLRENYLLRFTPAGTAGGQP